MGADFIERAGKSVRKSWDRERTELAKADLFTHAPSCLARTAAAELSDGVELEVDDHLTVEAHDGQLFARQGNLEVARFRNAPPDLVEAIENSCGIAKGKVEKVHKLAGVVEVSIC